MQRRRPQPERYLRSVSALIASLMRLPEIATIQYEPAGESLRLRFLLAGGVPEAELATAGRRLLDSLEVMAGLERRPMDLCQVEWRAEETLAWVEVLRDPASMSMGEVYLICEYLRDQFPDRLVVDGGDPYLMEEDALANEELIAEVLTDLRRGRGKGPLVAIREEGRLMVFSK